MPKKPYVRKKRATETDVEVGRRVRALRLERGLSQTALAGDIGVTFQQVQKYEKGVNRVGAGRLQEIAGILGVPASFFFEGNHELPRPSAESDSMFSMAQTVAELRLMKAFRKINGRNKRMIVVELAEILAS